MTIQYFTQDYYHVILFIIIVRCALLLVRNLPLLFLRLQSFVSSQPAPKPFIILLLSTVLIVFLGLMYAGKINSLAFSIGATFCLSCDNYGRFGFIKNFVNTQGLQTVGVIILCLVLISFLIIHIIQMMNSADPEIQAIKNKNIIFDVGILIFLLWFVLFLLNLDIIRNLTYELGKLFCMGSNC